MSALLSRTIKIITMQIREGAIRPVDLLCDPRTHRANRQSLSRQSPTHVHARFKRRPQQCHAACIHLADASTPRLPCRLQICRKGAGSPFG